MVTSRLPDYRRSAWHLDPLVNWRSLRRRHLYLACRAILKQVRHSPETLFRSIIRTSRFPDWPQWLLRPECFRRPLPPAWQIQMLVGEEITITSSLERFP